MNLAILFWFYKEPEVCENRLRILKKYNPDLKVFGLYGGNKDAVHEYQDRLAGYLNDFYVFTANSDEDWKWINGDLMILDWYEKRGKDLNWDSIVVIQWDMLVFNSFLNQFQGLKKDQIFLSGLRILDKEIENDWDWTRPDRKYRENYLNFLEYVKKNYNYNEQPLCCLFILQIFPKIFFDEYLTVKNKEVGMLEYKIPIYAKIFNIPFFEKDIGTMWSENKLKPLSAEGIEISEEYIKEQLGKKDGWRIFHPYFKIWK